MIEGKIYRIVAEHTDDIYIGSTRQDYASKRMACHRQNAKNCIGNYGDLFSDINKSPPWMEILECCEVDHPDILRMKEREYIEAEPNAVNLRCAYLSPEETKERHKIAVEKYQSSNKGKIAMAKSKHNQSVKRYKCQITLLEEQINESEKKKNEWYEAYKDQFHHNQDEITGLECRIEDLLNKVETMKKKSMKT